MLITNFDYDSCRGEIETISGAQTADEAIVRGKELVEKGTQERLSENAAWLRLNPKP